MKLKDATGMITKYKLKLPKEYAKENSLPRWVNIKSGWNKGVWLSNNSERIYPLDLDIALECEVKE